MTSRQLGGHTDRWRRASTSTVYAIGIQKREQPTGTRYIYSMKARKDQRCRVLAAVHCRLGKNGNFKQPDLATWATNSTYSQIKSTTVTHGSNPRLRASKKFSTCPRPRQVPRILVQTPHSTITAPLTIPKTATAQTPIPPSPSSTLVAQLVLALPVGAVLAVTVLSTLVVEGPVALVEAGTVD